MSELGECLQLYVLERVVPRSARVSSVTVSQRRLTMFWTTEGTLRPGLPAPFPVLSLNSLLLPVAKCSTDFQHA